MAPSILVTIASFERSRIAFELLRNDQLILFLELQDFQSVLV